MSTNTFGQRFRRAARPASAFTKTSKPGTTVYGRIIAAVEEPKLKFGGAPGEVELDEDGQPVMQTVVTLDTGAGPRNLYVSWRMEQAIGQAMEAAGAEDFEIGATLSVTYTGPDPEYSRARLFTAVYTSATERGGA
ncbi:hypothetical protein IU427_17815 [Nocardia beijingensis]|uniref:hypothetical protein n=1 Tax=Nocardia beijingensis TaxID=95162 RepID=UPI001894B53C|nr:hypothetical protein [Nocardia beijingensis]MBF6467024.1 hypothetical protein [Nocardia beijingensis]